MTDYSSPDVPLPSKELHLLRSKKETLQNVIKIARALTRLHQSLQAILLLGCAASKAPKHAMRFYAALSEEAKHLPANILQQDLQAVDRLVRQDFASILAIADDNDTHFPLGAAPAVAAPLGHEGMLVHKLLDEFRRRAQTAVSLRIILRERGIATARFVLPVPEAILQKQIEALEKKETHYKARIRTDVIAMQADVEALLKNAAFPDAIQHELRQTQQGLQQNIEHIDAGLDLDNLPFPIELVESTEAIHSKNEFAGTEIKSAAIQKEATRSRASAPAPLGFFRKLWLWSTNPMREPWSKIGTEESSRRLPK